MTDHKNESPDEDNSSTLSADNLSELVGLITVRQYVVNSVGNHMLDKATVNYMNGLSMLMDKKIVGLLKSKQFKDYVNYQDIKQTIEDVVKITNIKYNMKK